METPMRSMWIRILAATFLLFCVVSAKDKSAAPKSDKAEWTAISGKLQKVIIGTSKFNCESTSDTLDRLLVLFMEARKSEDKAKMASALDQAEAHIFGMKAKMSQCMDLMDMIGGMIADKPAAVNKGIAKDE